MAGKSILYLAHRRLGLALAGLVAVWFVSGMVMVFVQFPTLLPSERLAGLAPLDLHACRFPPRQAWIASGQSPDSPPARIRLQMLLGRPVWRFLHSHPPAASAVHADDASPVAPLSESQAQRIATEFFDRQSPTPNSPPPIASTHRIDYDQWTVFRSYDPHRPLFRITFQDPAHTTLYVSQRSGEVLLDTTRAERFWNWLGAVPHWLYFAALRRNPSLWRATVIAASTAAVLLTFTGLLVGALRWRPTSTTFRSSPYRGWKRHHHFAGLSIGFLALTWSFSGLLSMNPGNAFDTTQPHPDHLSRWTGGTWNGSQLPILPPSSHHPPTVDSIPRELELIQFAGAAYQIVFTQSNSPHLSPLTPSSSNSPPAIGRLDPDKMLRQAAALLPEFQIHRHHELTDYDAYYYAHHWRDPAPLPVLRVEFNDAAQTWFHLDPHSGKILDRQTSSSRARRWLYHGLHSLDFPWLMARPRLWTVLILSLLGCGAWLSLTGCAVALKRFSHVLLPGFKPHPQKPTAISNSSANI